MGVSDLITLIGLVVAIVALISEQNRDFLLLKFTKTHGWIIFIVFCLLNYLVFFDYFFTADLYFDSLIVEKSLLPKDWAYVLTLATLIFIIYRIFFGFFPKSNKNKVIEYYNNLLFNGEHLNIISQFEKYHKKALLKHLIDKTKSDTEIIYANNIYHEILSREDFINKTASLRPYFYCDIISLFKEMEFTNRSVIACYLKTLISNKNQFLFREIRNNQNYDDGGFIYRLPEENKILGSLLIDLDVAHNNLVWQPFGECVTEELKLEKEIGFLSVLNKPYQTKDPLWNTITYNSVWFFDIMVRKGIYEKYESHFWLHYYKFFIEELLSVLEINEINNVNENAEFPTNIHFIIGEIFSNLEDWLMYCAKSKNDFHHHDIAKCIGACLKIVCESPRVLIKFKEHIVIKAISLYFKTYHTKESLNINSNLIKCYTVHDGLELKSEYIEAFLSGWNKFDKVPYQGFESTGIVEAFENDVLKILRKNQ